VRAPRSWRGLRRRFRGRRTRTSTNRWMTASFFGGVVAGLFVWSLQMQRSRRDLFSKNPVRRFAALGHLGGSAPSLEALQLLTEYLRWENKPILRKRAQVLLNRMQRRLS
jgi:hypothetical protein